MTAHALTPILLSAMAFLSPAMAEPATFTITVDGEVQQASVEDRGDTHLVTVIEVLADGLTYKMMYELAPDWCEAGDGSRIPAVIRWTSADTNKTMSMRGAKVRRLGKSLTQVCEIHYDVPGFSYWPRATGRLQEALRTPIELTISAIVVPEEEERSDEPSANQG